MFVVAVAGVCAIATEARPATIAIAVTSLVIITLLLVAACQRGNSHVVFVQVASERVQQGPRQSPDAGRIVEVRRNSTTRAATQ